MLRALRRFPYWSVLAKRTYVLMPNHNFLLLNESIGTLVTCTLGRVLSVLRVVPALACGVVGV